MPALFQVPPAGASGGVPDDGSVTDVKVAAAAAIAESKLALAADAAAGVASRRTLGAGATQAAAGNHTHSQDPAIAALIASRMYMAGAVETMPRLYVSDSGANPLASQRLYLMFFRPHESRTVSNFFISVGGTAAGGITLARMGLYTVANPDGTGLACVAASANDTTLGTTTFTNYTKAFSTATVGGQAMPTSYAVTAGQHYALGLLWVGTTMPKFYGCSYVPNSVCLSPRIVGSLAGQSNLPLNPAGLSDSPACVVHAALL